MPSRGAGRGAELARAFSKPDTGLIRYGSGRLVCAGLSASAELSLRHLSATLRLYRASRPLSKKLLASRRPKSSILKATSPVQPV